MNEWLDLLFLQIRPWCMDEWMHQAWRKIFLWINYLVCRRSVCVQETSHRRWLLASTSYFQCNPVWWKKTIRILVSRCRIVLLRGNWLPVIILKKHIIISTIILNVSMTITHCTSRWESHFEMDTTQIWTAHLNWTRNRRLFIILKLEYCVGLLNWDELISSSNFYYYHITLF